MEVCGCRHDPSTAAAHDLGSGDIGAHQAVLYDVVLFHSDLAKGIAADQGLKRRSDARHADAVVRAVHYDPGAVGRRNSSGCIRTDAAPIDPG